MLYLNANASQKVIPNPPTALQLSIDNGIKEFQQVLDDIDYNIQLSLQYVRKAIEDRKKNGGSNAEPDKSNNATTIVKTENNGDSLKDTNKANEKEESNQVTAESAADNNNQSQSNAEDITVISNGFDTSNLGAFDDDLNALLGSVSGSADQTQQENNDDMGGLFGDDFDFILPGQ